MLAKNGSIVEVNEAFLRLFELERERLRGRGAELLGLSGRGRFRGNPLSALLARKKTLEIDIKHRTRSGRELDARFAVKRVRVDGSEFLLGVVQDITERERLAEQLRLERQRLDTILRASDLLVFVQDKSLRYRWVANSALGITAEDLLGRRDSDVLSPDAARPLMRAKRRVLRTGSGERIVVFRTRAGRAGWFDVTLEPLRAPDGRVEGIIGVAANITQHKQALEALAASEQRLRQFGANLQDRLEEERSEIARDVHDHLGSQLVGIRMRAESLARKLRRDPSMARELGAMARSLSQAIEAARSLCAKIRPVSLADAGTAGACREYVREWAALSGIHASFRAFAGAGQLPAPLALELFRCLQELLNNVARHSAARRVRVLLSGGSRCTARLTVVDDGRGFATDAARMGLGLLGLRERARRYGGGLDIRSDRSGTRAQVCFRRDHADEGATDR